MEKENEKTEIEKKSFFLYSTLKVITLLRKQMFLLPMLFITSNNNNNINNKNKRERESVEKHIKRKTHRIKSSLKQQKLKTKCS